MSDSTDSETPSAPDAVWALGLPFVFLLEAVVMKTLWLWFVVPLGAPPLGLAHASGLTMLVGLAAAHFPPRPAIDARLIAKCCPPSTTQHKELTVDIAATMKIGMKIPLIALGIGALCHWCM